MRSEQEIFDDLERLCTSPGYVHTIAYFCFRDNMIPYAGEMTARDLQNLFSPTRLVRTEISTLIGLLIKREIDYTLPSADKTQQYITNTESLLEEMHLAMARGMFGELDLRQVLDKRIDVFSHGAALREPIFYSGESAYAFQYRDFSTLKYAADNEWLKANKGFSIQSARDVFASLGKLQEEKLISLAYSIRREKPSNWTMLPGFSFTTDELIQAGNMPRDVVARVLAAFAVRHGANNQNFHALHDFNVANATPILGADDETLVLFQQYSILEALYDSPFYWMISDSSYKDSAMQHRGTFTEEFSKARLIHVFGKDRVFSNVSIYEKKDQKVGEIDVLVIFGDRAIVLQAKSKRLTLETRKGNDNQIKDDFKKSVQDSYDQGYGCAALINNPALAFVDANGKALTIPQDLKEIYIICVVSDHYPALSFQTRQFLKFQTTNTIQPPFVMDIFTLDTMAEMLESPLQFLSYLNRRTGYSGKLWASHELVILSHHLKRNLWLEKQYDQVMLDDDISADLDVAMSVRRDHIPGKRTPDGILTRVSQTAVGRVIKEVEARSEPGMMDLGFLLLALSEDAVLKISRAMEATARRAQRDGKSHDITMSVSEAGAGLTVHCNDEPLSTAAPRLQSHCALRKYAAKANRWYGICLQPADLSLRFGVNLNYDWKPDPQMDPFLHSLGGASRLDANVRALERKRKVGRNDPCPCGSGLKYKKCCGR